MENAGVLKNSCPKLAALLKGAVCSTPFVDSKGVMKILVHHCITQELVTYGLKEPSPDVKCRCKKQISLRRATQLVHNGEATWITVARERGDHQQSCRLCGSDKEVKNCALCKGVGFTVEPYANDTLGNDILLVSRNPIDSKEKKSFFLKGKTPRTPTIEEGHIRRMFDFEDVKERIENYGWLIQLVWYELGAEIRYRKQPGKLPETLKGYEGHPEPADNPKTGEGRNYDQGRAI